MPFIFCDQVSNVYIANSILHQFVLQVILVILVHELFYTVLVFGLYIYKM